MSRRHVLLRSAGALATAGLAACTPGRQPGRSLHEEDRSAAGGAALGLGIVGLSTEDLAASLDFYRRLGLAIPEGVDTAAGAYRLRMPNDTIFFWETTSYIRGFDPTYRPGTGDRKVVLEFGFPSAEAVDAAYDRLLAAGARGHLPPTTWSQGTIRYAIVVDPDENQVSLRWPLTS